MNKAFLAIALFCAAALPAQDRFALKEGDRVVFFGDSITDARLYNTFVETYAVTRFPSRNITFVHSGWGGDRVTGGGGGGIRQRLERDVFAYNPSVVTIMLGMNDGRYRPFDQQIFDIYANGYRSIVKDLKAKFPAVRITAIQPSPFDDVTRAPRFPGGYNAVLLRYGQFLAELAGKESLTLADLNTPVTAMLQRAKAADAASAEKIVPDRVHPGPSGHLIMAGALLKAWNAPGVVSDVQLDAGAKKVARSENTSVTNASFGSSIRWTQADNALPVPVDMSDAVVALAVKSSDFQETLNRQMLSVKGLRAAKYTLSIDGNEIGTFSAAQLEAGVNLSAMKTPMWEQAWRVHQLTLKRAAIHNTRWRSVQVPMEWEKPASVDGAMSALDAVDAELGKAQRAMAAPKAHQFELREGESQFKPIFNGTDLTGWHISKVNHHGMTEAWKVEDGAITGTQDKPGHGGILLTDRKYKNFEVALEVRPDLGCDSGLFLRSSEKGEAYQVLLDYLDGGAIGGIYGERLQGVRGQPVNWREPWKGNDWNHLRARIEGDVPRIQVWINGVKVTDFRDTANHAAGGAVDGMIAVQVHAGNRWIPGGKHRYRNMVVRELP